MFVESYLVGLALEIFGFYPGTIILYLFGLLMKVWDEVVSGFFMISRLKNNLSYSVFNGVFPIIFLTLVGETSILDSFNFPLGLSFCVYWFSIFTNTLYKKESIYFFLIAH